LSKSNKVYLIYAALGLVPLMLILFLDIDSKTAKDAEDSLLHGITHFFQYPLYMGFALVGFLCFKLNQNRILFAVMLLLGASFLLFNPLTLQPLGIGVKGLYYVVAMSFPLTLAIIFSIRETRPMDLPNIGRLAMSLIPILVLSYLVARDVSLFSKIAFLKIIPGLNPKNGFLFPQLSLISLAIFGVVIFFQKDRFVKPFLRVLGITMIPLMAGLWAGIALYSEIFKQTEIRELYKLIKRSPEDLKAYQTELATDERLSHLSGEYAIAMMDIDHFKAFNDNYGHDEGDNVLRLVGSLLSEELGDRVYRYGGEEFCAIFNGVSAEDAYMFANKVRRKLEERQFYIRKPNSKREATSSFDRRRAKKNNGKKVQITISIGLANPTKKAKTVEAVIKLADQSLYQAKKKGRNRVIISEVEGVKSAV